jgi:hypothetical protein
VCLQEKKEPAFDEFAGPQRRSRKGSTKTKGLNICHTLDNRELF